MDQKIVMQNIRALETAIKDLGETAKAAGDGETKQVIGAVLGSSVGLAAQLYGVEAVRAVLLDFVTGDLSEQFWKMQKELHDSEKKKIAPDAPGLAKVPSAPGSVPSP